MTETIKYTSTLIDKNLLASNAEKETIKLFANHITMWQDSKYTVLRDNFPSVEKK